jgi:hypothetical protein
MDLGYTGTAWTFEKKRLLEVPTAVFGWIMLWPQPVGLSDFLWQLFNTSRWLLPTTP